MIELLKDWSIKRLLFFILIFLIVTDLAILLNIPLLRQTLGFLCFTIIPGLLILHLLKLNKIGLLKKLVLSIGLSIAFLMFVGLLLNQLYLAIGISKPLSTSSLVISFTFILVIMAFIAYRRNKDSFDCADVLNVKPNFKKAQFISPLFFPLIFPFLAVFGTYLMNTQGNNIILLAMLLLIPSYVVAVVYLRDRIPKSTYPVAILAIGIALVLMHGLTSNYLNGRDVHSEYYTFRVVASNLCWSMSNCPNALTACLSTSLLPTIYWSLMGINKLYIYKLVYQLIWAITPLVCYVLFKKYVNELYAFLASVFFMSQMPFISVLQSAVRTELAIFFFAFALMVFFDDEVDKLNKRILLLVFIFAVIVSHYSTSYIFFIMIFMFWLVTVPMKSFFKLNPYKHFGSSIKDEEKSNFFTGKNAVSATIVVLFFAWIFFWYSQLTNTKFTDGVLFIQNTFVNLVNLFVEESREESFIQSITGQNITELSRGISLVVHWIAFSFIFLGVIDFIRGSKNKKAKFEREYLLMVLIAGGILVAHFLPYVSVGYGSARGYQQSLVLLALGFVVGGKAICKYIRRPQFSLVVITIVLVSQFFCATYVVHQVLGNPYSEDLNRAGDAYGELYIHDQEVIGAKWLNERGANNSKIYTDMSGGIPLLFSCEIGKKPHTMCKFFSKNEAVSRGYIYLRYVNVVDGKIYPYVYEEGKNITEYPHLFVGKSKVYNNGGSEIWK